MIKCGTVKLCINNDKEVELSRIFQYYEKKVGAPLTYLSLGVYLNEIGKSDLAIQYYETLLQVLKDSDNISLVENNLAIIYEHQNKLLGAKHHRNQVITTQKMDNLETSMPLFEKKMEVIMANPVTGTTLIINHYNLACVYQQARRFDEALEECKRALKISTELSNPIDVALIHDAMGSTYFSKKQHKDALESFQMALDIALVHCLPTDPLIDRYLNNIRLLNNIVNEKQS